MITSIIERDDSIWQGHPDVAYFNHYLFVVYRESERHLVGSDTCIKLIKGHLDENKKFVKLTTKVIEKSQHRLNCPRLSVINNKLYIICDKIISPDENYFTSENIEKNSRVFIWESSDGDRWGYPIATNVTGIVPDRICHFKDQLLIATHTQKENRLVQNVWNAQSITDKWNKNILADVGGLNLCEGSIINDDDKLICLLRENSGMGHPAFVTTSLNGIDWTPVCETKMFGCHRPVLGKLSSGKYLVTCREQISQLNPMYWARNTFAYLCVNYYFNNFILLPLDHDNSKIKSDSGYTGWAQLDDNSIFVVNYITGDAPKPYIKGYLIDESDF